MPAGADPDHRSQALLEHRHPATQPQPVHRPRQECASPFVCFKKHQRRIRPLVGNHEAREATPGPHIHQARCRREERPGHRHEPTRMAQLLFERSRAEEAELARLGQEPFQGSAHGGGADSIVGAWHRRSVSRRGR